MYTLCMNKGDIIVRDVRVKSHFVIDDEYLNGFAKLCGPSATMVYLCLCRHADQGQRAFPSIKLMEEKIGVSKMTVIRGIATLVAHNIIIKGQQRNPNSGRWWNNSYLLQDKSVWNKSPGTTSDTWSPGTKKQHHRVPLVVSTGYHPADTKDSHRRIHIEGLETNEEGKNATKKKIDSVKQSLVAKGVLH